MKICCNLQENVIKLHYVCKSPAKVKCYNIYGVYATWRSKSLTHVSSLTAILKTECLFLAPGHEKNHIMKASFYVHMCDFLKYIFTKYSVLSHTDAFVYRAEEM